MSRWRRPRSLEVRSALTALAGVALARTAFVPWWHWYDPTRGFTSFREPVVLGVVSVALGLGVLVLAVQVARGARVSAATAVASLFAAGLGFANYVLAEFRSGNVVQFEPEPQIPVSPDVALFLTAWVVAILWACSFVGARTSRRRRGGAESVAQREHE